MDILLKSQYTIKSASPEDKLALITSPNQIYTGPYMDTIYNTKYSGTSRNILGPELISLISPIDEKSQNNTLYDILKPSMRIETLKRNPRPGKNKPTEAPLFTRYFFLDSRTKVFIESNKTEVNNLIYIDTNIFLPFFVNWYTHPEWGMGKNIITVNSLKRQGKIKISPGDFVQNSIYTDAGEFELPTEDLFNFDSKDLY